MVKLATLKRHARKELAKLDLELPVFTWESTDNPFKLNAIFTQREWELDSPLASVTKARQDWIHWFVCDPSQGTYLEIFFERTPEQIAVVSAQLKINDRHLVLKQSFYKDNSDVHAYSAGGIRLECTAPMRGWRLALNVMMEEPATGSELHVQVGARVAMVGHTLELPKQVRPSFLARRFKGMENLAEAKLEISKCVQECQAISQPVSAFAEVTVNGQREELMLFGSRLKFFGESSLLHNAHIYIGYAENGTTFTAIEAEDKAYGYCLNPIHFTQPIRKTRWSSYCADEELPSKMLHFQAAERKYELDLGRVETEVTHHIAEGSLLSGKQEFRMIRTVLKRSDGNHPPLSKLELCKLLEWPEAQNESLLLTISDPACKDPRLTGGKGSSLATLTGISSHLKTFTVPSAVVLTVNAYAVFAGTPEVSAAIEEFLEASKLANMAALKKASDKCVGAVSSAGLPESIQTMLMDKLLELFGPLWYLKKFAVRSSAVGEDSEEMSAAGQMTTYLGMRGEREIATAVVKCWASQFALTAVNYKRQYGQALNSSMAVVVQEMVSAESAGVMFTCDPVTSHPSGIFITANFGLGESVVSASADPDTYSLRRAGSAIVLKTKTRGAKDSMVVESDIGGGTKEMSIHPDKKQSFCLTDECAIEIASIGAALTDITDSPRDIEWAVVRGKIYLLQSRPVTSFLRESDFEIRHDSNSGFYTNREILCRANLDEVLPGVFSTLGICVFGHLLFEVVGKKMSYWGKKDPSQFTYQQNVCCGKKTYLNFSHHGFASNEKIMKTNAVTMFGYDISDHEALKKGIVHVGAEPPSLAIISMLLSALRSLKPVVEKTRLEADLFALEPPENGDALSLFLSAVQQISKLEPFMTAHIAATMSAAIFNVLSLNLVTSSQGAEDFTPDSMLLLSKLLKSDLEVESAHIPEELTALSNALKGDPNAASFLETTPEEALDWLETDEGSAAKQFRELRTKHAHRCYKEFDVHSRTWDIDPIPLVKTLQSTARCPAAEGAKKDDDTMTVDQLPKRPSLLQRKLLNFLIPRAQYAVYAREALKSALVKSIHKIRLAMRKVGLQLQAEGRLPDPELIFFLSCDEVYRLIKTKDPSLLPRALWRQKMHPILDQERFPVLLYGMPKPIDSTTIVIDPNAESMEGVPVSKGIVTGPARVILDFINEAHLITKGEILVTRATDTGWTPYFPLLGGVVTEVGGLLSHGAVVAREYGLPAIVGLAGVTELVKSGDIVTLDGNKGMLHRSPVSKNTGEVSITENEHSTNSLDYHECKQGKVQESSSEESATELESQSPLNPGKKATADIQRDDRTPLIRCQV